MGAPLLIMVILLILSSTAIYYVEHGVQPEKFGSIPAAMWWAIATLTTVGYGDAVPLTHLGRVIGGLVMILGLAMFALPVGIIASGFSTEIHRRDFIVTWGMVARVPIFAKLGMGISPQLAVLLFGDPLMRAELHCRMETPCHLKMRWLRRRAPAPAIRLH